MLMWQHLSLCWSPAWRWTGPGLACTRRGSSRISVAQPSYTLCEGHLKCSSQTREKGAAVHPQQWPQSQILISQTLMPVHCR